jgi:hypothetical protein
VDATFRVGRLVLLSADADSAAGLHEVMSIAESEGEANCRWTGCPRDQPADRLFERSLSSQMIMLPNGDRSLK